jgi:hypothetical protein
METVLLLFAYSFCAWGDREVMDSMDHIMFAVLFGTLLWVGIIIYSAMKEK